ncbi:MAG: phosphohistidine phosphatase SixA [Cyanobacteriota bacterium]|jgi:phosphohistidine phosphatase
MLELLLLRHGIAADAADDAIDPELADRARPLTPAGRRRTAAVLQRLLALDLACTQLFSSPLLRARQTAELALQAGLAPVLHEAPALAPGGDAAGWLQQHSAGQRLNGQRWALVGHEPDLSSLAAGLIGAAPGSLQLKKAGVALLAWTPEQSRARLLLLVPPRVLL